MSSLGKSKQSDRIERIGLLSAKVTSIRKTRVRSTHFVDARFSRSNPIKRKLTIYQLYKHLFSINMLGILYVPVSERNKDASKDDPS